MDTAFYLTAGFTTLVGIIRALVNSDPVACYRAIQRYAAENALDPRVVSEAVVASLEPKEA